MNLIKVKFNKSKTAKDRVFRWNQISNFNLIILKNSLKINLELSLIKVNLELKTQIYLR